MRKIALMIGIMTLGITTIIHADIPTVPAAQPAASVANLSMNFIQTADTASIQPVKNKPGYYYLIMRNTGPYITYFTNRPNQYRGLIPAQDFIKAWDQGTNNFAGNHPNGAVIAGKINDQQNTGNIPMLVTLQNPVYNADHDVMAYVVTPLYTQTLFLKPFTLDQVTLIFGS